MPLDASMLEQMQRQVEAWEATGDRRAIFLTCYAMMTSNMLAALQTGAFEDQEWVHTLLERFAEYYFSALQSYDSQSDSLPSSWRAAFEACARPQGQVLQELILGVNAHINYDLVFVLADLLRDEWSELSPQQRLVRYRDHCHVNEIIYQTIDSVQDQVIERYSPGMDLVDRFLGGLDEWLTGQIIQDWREEVWQHASQLLACTQTSEIETIQVQVEQHAARRAQALLGKQGLRGFTSIL